MRQFYVCTLDCRNHGSWLQIKKIHTGDTPMRQFYVQHWELVKPGTKKWEMRKRKEEMALH